MPPLFKPAGANHGAATLSLKAYTLGITVDAGTHTFLPRSVSGIELIHQLLFHVYHQPIQVL